jgi:hypothetical protein
MLLLDMPQDSNLRALDLIIVGPSVTRIFGLGKRQAGKSSANTDQHHASQDIIFSSFLKMQKVLQDVEIECARSWRQVTSGGSFDLLRFIEIIEDHLKDLDTNLRQFEQERSKSGTLITPSVKDNACPSTLKIYEAEFNDRKREMKSAYNSGDDVNSLDIIDLIDICQKIARCYTDAVQSISKEFLNSRFGSHIHSRMSNSRYIP